MKNYISVTIWLLLFSVSGYANQSYSTLAAGSFPQYDLSIRIMPDAHRLEVIGTMRLPATNPPRDSIELSLSELITDFRVEVVNPASAAGSAMTEKVAVRPYSRPGWGTATWRVHLPHQINANAPATLRFSYTGGGAHTSFIFSLESEVCFGAGIGTAWYPEIEDGAVQSDGRLRGVRGTGS